MPWDLVSWVGWPSMIGQTTNRWGQVSSIGTPEPAPALRPPAAVLLIVAPEPVGSRHDCRRRLAEGLASTWRTRSMRRSDAALGRTVRDRQRRAGGRLRAIDRDRRRDGPRRSRRLDRPRPGP